MDRLIVVGVDGSAQSLSAVDFAAQEARLRHAGLHIVHAFMWPLLHVPLAPAPGGPPDGGLLHQAEQFLAEATGRVGPGVAVTTGMVNGGPSAVLIEASRQAELLVVGNRGLGGFTGLLAGSVSSQVVAHASVPVVVVRDGAQLQAPELPNLPVLVGVDGSAHTAAVLDFAFAEAAARGATLHALHAWTHPESTGPGDMLLPVYDTAAEQEEASLVLAECLAGWADKYPDVPVYRQVVHANPRRALIDASGKAGLAVVGSHGHGGFSGMLLGSVSQALVHHAHCPVAVVRPTR